MKISFFSNRTFKFLLGLLFFLFFTTFINNVYTQPPPPTPPVKYTTSAHGNSTYGVERNDYEFSQFGYARGKCAHCHEQHASIGGDEPFPDFDSSTLSGVGPDIYELFADLFVNQGNMFCFGCHCLTGSSVVQILPYQYNYSRIAGGDNNTSPISIYAAFQLSGSTHSLSDIQNFLTPKPEWNFGDELNPPLGTINPNNPCSGCHNPHLVKRDPHGSGTPARTDPNGNLITSSVSRPSFHSKDSKAWGLWGDEADERMKDYTPNYQAPYRYSSTTTYEPDGSAYTDGRNLVDFVSLCTDCHNATNIIYSTALARNLRTIDWDNEKHGKGNANDAISMDNPYGSVMGKVTACTDCHEPHGAPNKVLIRQEVNGATLSTITTIDPFVPPACASPYSNYDATKSSSIANLCDRCHKDDYDFNTGCQQDHWYIIHHDNASGDPFYTGGMCVNCHSGGSGPRSCTNTNPAINCNCCHYHGSTYTYGATTWRTF
jgi:predicted CXXCH cytochrome family protein